MARFCTNCGKQLSTHTIACHHCGAQFGLPQFQSAPHRTSKSKVNWVYKLVIGSLVVVVTVVVVMMVYVGENAKSDRESYQTKAEQGDASAQLGLGRRLLEDERWWFVILARLLGAPQDDAAAVKWFSKAAEQGDARAQYHLGNMFREGRSVPQDYAEAIKWYLKAAKKDILARTSLEEMVVESDEGLKTLRSMADQGDAKAQEILGDLYDEGKGIIPVDTEQALRWYKLAAEQGSEHAAMKMGYKFYEGDGVLKDGLETAKWWLLASANGDPLAGYNLELLNPQDAMSPKDATQRADWYRMGADQGIASAQLLLGGLYADGDGVQTDHARAVRLWRSAADNEKGLDPVRATAQWLLGEAYYDGTGETPKDYAAALKWYQLAAERGSAEAQHKLGVMYVNGQGIPRDYAAGARWYRKAAEQGHAYGQAALGACYFSGRGVTKDYFEAYLWLNLAATSGPPQLVKLRNAAEAKLTPSQISEAQRLAREWKPKAWEELKEEQEEAGR